MTPPDATATPMRALILQHEEPTPPGLVTEWLGGHGASVETFRIDIDDHEVDPTRYDLIVSLGSEFAAFDDTKPFVPREASLLRRAVDAEVPVLGLCFGGQMLARVLGGEVYRVVRLGDRLAPGEEHRPRAGAGRTVVPVALRHVHASARSDPDRRDGRRPTGVRDGSEPRAAVPSRGDDRDHGPTGCANTATSSTRTASIRTPCSRRRSDAPWTASGCRGSSGLVPPRRRATPPAPFTGDPRLRRRRWRGRSARRTRSVFPRFLDLRVPERRARRRGLAHHDRRPAHPRRLLRRRHGRVPRPRCPRGRRGGGRAGRAHLVLLQPPLHERAAGAARRPPAGDRGARRWRGSGSSRAAPRPTRRRCSSRGSTTWSEAMRTAGG